MLKDGLPEDWKRELKSALDSPSFQELERFVAREREAATVFPSEEDLFSAFRLTPYADVRVLLLGQDPYHGPGQAHGLAFSVKPGVPSPPSLVNIFKELKRDLNLDIPQHGYLQRWAEQGVLMLNTSLTVERGLAGSHAKAGWQQFTDRIIEVVGERRPHLVFMLWGAHAQSKAKLIDATRHLMLKSVHPSPLSAHRGFIGNGHFSRANQFLRQQGMQPIDWQLPAQV